MFEKEAKERAEKLEKNQTLGVYDNDEDLARDEGFNDGEVAGYEKGFKDGAEFGYNKANEWQYPSKGKLPKCDEETQLIFYVNCYYKVGGETLTRKRMVLGYYKKSFLRDDVKLFVEKSRGYEDEHLPQDVIAWKEIVLPELKESE